MAEKINIGTNFSLYPMPVVLVGTTVAGKPNFMAVGWISRVNFKPPIVGIAIHKGHYTPNGIQESKSFSINIPGVDLVLQTDYCGIVSGRKVDKSTVFDIFYGETQNAPMIRQCPICAECRLYQVVELPTNNFYLGEVVATYTEDRYLTDGKPDIEKMKPFVLTMTDNRYWRIGEFLENAWSCGKQLNATT